MLKTYLNLCVVAAFAFFMVACAGENTDNTITTPDANTTEVDKPEPTPEPKSEETSTSDLETKITGVWMQNHEPGGLDLHESGDYNFFTPISETTNEVYETGGWVVEGEFVILTSDDTSVKPAKLKVNWITEDVIYLGNLEEEYEADYGTKEDYAMEFGMSRLK
ncbi:MAG: hypothetical protein GY810_26905 [Aureispira sp.]|nr:hypothetical protein [Aureispira sp.]